MRLLLTLFLFLSAVQFSLIAQTIKGTIKDNLSSEPLTGATVLIKGTQIGANADLDGNFEIKYEGTFPCTLVVSYIGFETQEVEVKDNKKTVQISLSEPKKGGPEVEIVDSRLSEKQKESPLTVESMDIIAIKETPAANFYDGLGQLKGVDVTASSMGFKIINTRGFNTTRPVRSLQLIDGMDNQAPGLNFSLGNFVGASELDVQSVDVIVGASSAMYGPNAFNGTINMKTKSPFDVEGFSAMFKGAERFMFEGAARFAKAFKLKKDADPNFAFKINLAAIRADDWRAINYEATETSLNPVNDIRGWDAINRYGDEFYTGGVGISDRRNRTGLGRVYRTGYREDEVVDYNMSNLKLNGSIHYKPTKNIELQYFYNFGTGSTIFQGDNRYRLKDIIFQQHKIEAKSDKWFVRAYTTLEDAGKSYDAVFASLLLQRRVKSEFYWFSDYNNYWDAYVMPKIRAIPGFNDTRNETFTIGTPTSNPRYYEQMDSLLKVMEAYIPTDSLAKWHQESRTFADGVGNPLFGNKARVQPGTPEFETLLDSIINESNFNSGGAKLVDKSKLYHVQGEYKFTPKFATIIVGGSYRMYIPRSNGSVFSDTLLIPGDPNSERVKISVWEAGSYVMAEKKVLAERLKINLACRADKNQNFNFIFSPAASLVYTVKKNHNYRFSFSSAVRNPTLQDQYLYYNFGRAILVGNRNGYQNILTYESMLDFLASSGDTSVLQTFSVDKVRPEEVRSLEIGYKGSPFKNFFLDCSYYFSWYKNFLGYKLGGQIPDKNDLRNLVFYRISANSPDMVNTQGFSAGMNYFFKKFYAVNGNYSYNILDKRGSTDPIIPAFNTPRHKFNIGFSVRDFYKDVKMGSKTLKLRNWGASVNFKWSENFYYEGSPQFTGAVPVVHSLDAQINKKVVKWKTTFKLGASNILNTQRFMAYGSPLIGRLAYLSALVEF